MIKLNGVCEPVNYRFKHEREILEEIDRNEFFNEINVIDKIALKKSLNIKMEIK